MLCPHSRHCPGCPLIDLDYAAQLVKKGEVLARALHAYFGLAEAPVAETVGAEPITGFRVRAKLVADGRRLGLFARGTHRIVDIPQCRIQRPRLLAVAARLRESLGSLGAVSAFDLREADAGVLVTAAVEPGVEPAARRALAERIRSLDMQVVSVAVSTREHDAPQVLGSNLEVLVGPSALRHQPDPAAPWHYAAHGAFTQAHAGQLARLHAAIEDALSPGPSAPSSPAAPRARRVLELYAGSGALSLRLAARGHHVTLVEAFAPAVTMAERAAAEQGLALDAITADTAVALAELARRGARFDTVIVNPPRRGVAPEVRRLLAELAPSRLLYVSCAPDTLARDAEQLGLLGFALASATPFDMIPLSEAVEALAVFHRAPFPVPRVLGENEAFLAVDKEPHAIVDTGPGGRGSLLERVRRIPGAARAVAVDPLDAEASGVCLFARSPEHADAVSRWLATSRAEAVALVRGVIRARSKLPAERGLGADARYERLETDAGHSLIAVHAGPSAFAEATRALAAFRHPVLGDARRGDRRANLHFGLRHGLDRAFWHRRALELVGAERPLRLESALAPDLAAVLRSAARR